MNIKIGTQEMCDMIVNSLRWIDNEPDSELVQSLKAYRQKLINLPNTVVEGKPVIYPEDPRSTKFV